MKQIKAFHIEPAEKEGEPEEGSEEPPQMIPPRHRKRHIIEDNTDESEEKPLLLILSSKGKKKVVSLDESEDKAKDIDAELELVATRVTRTAAEKKSLLDIIAEITGEGSTATKPTPAASQQTPTRSTPTAPKGSSKRKEATYRGVTTPEKPEQKRTRPIQPKDVVPARTPPTNPTPSKRKKQPAIPPQGSPKDRLRNSSKKQ